MNRVHGLKKVVVVGIAAACFALVGIHPEWNLALSAQGNYADISKSILVKCNKGGGIQDAIDRTKPWVPLQVRIAGVCDESIMISRDDVTLLGITGNAAISSTTDTSVFIFGGQRIRIENLTLSGPEIPLSVDSSYVTLVDVTVEGSNDNGIDAVDGSHLNIEDSRIRDNGGAGIIIEKGGTLDLDDSVVSGNARTGVALSKNSSSVITNSQISENLNGPGLSVSESSSAKIQGETLIIGNERSGIDVALHSAVRVFSMTEVSGNGESGLFLAKDAGSEIIGPVVISGNADAAVRCDDAESSISIQDDSNINQAVFCTGF
jgi:hypothetical protein